MKISERKETVVIVTTPELFVDFVNEDSVVSMHLLSSLQLWSQDIFMECLYVELISSGELKDMSEVRNGLNKKKETKNKHEKVEP